MLVHQFGESNAGIAMVAAILVCLHLAMAALAVTLFVRDADAGQPPDSRNGHVAQMRAARPHPRAGPRGLRERLECERAHHTPRRGRRLILGGVGTVEEMASVHEGGRAAAVEVDRTFGSQLDHDLGQLEH